MELFTPQTLEFLFENRLNNSRSWFLEHHEQYEQLVLRPLRNLSEALSPTALEMDPEVVSQPQVGKTISRIRRDTRFSHDKSLYRDNMWIVFRRPKASLEEAPALYFEIRGQEFEYGCGFYHCSSPLMRVIREMILADSPFYKTAQTALQRQKVFHLEGECYQRAHYPGQPEEKRQWLERRNLCLTTVSSDAQLLFSDRLADTVAKHLSLLKPIYRFLLEACCTAQQTQE